MKCNLNIKMYVDVNGKQQMMISDGKTQKACVVRSTQDIGECVADFVSGIQSRKIMHDAIASAK